MNQRILIAAFVFLAVATVAGGAFALSQQSGNSSPGTVANVADPDLSVPPFLRAPGADADEAADDGGSQGSGGQGYISRDAVRQSTIRGNGSYLPPADSK